MKAHSNHKLSSAKKDQKKKQGTKKETLSIFQVYFKLWKKKEIQIYIHRSASWDGSS